MEGTGKACALQINPIVPLLANRKDIVVTDSVWNDGAFAPSGSKHKQLFTLIISISIKIK